MQLWLTPWGSQTSQTVFNIFGNSNRVTVTVTVIENTVQYNQALFSVHFLFSSSMQNAVGVYLFYLNLNLFQQYPSSSGMRL